jgi:hypothetical protein
MTSQPGQLNADAAYELAGSLEDPILREVIRFALSILEIQFLRPTDMSEQEFAEQLPSAPFDLLFFTKVLTFVFHHKDEVRRMLAGEKREEVFSLDDIFEKKPG